MGLAGFDFEGINRRWMASQVQPVNDAWRYGVTVATVRTPSAWRCLGVYHLTPAENRGRHNIFLDVLDETGKRIPGAVVNWRWADGAPVQTRKLDKLTSEPGADIDAGKDATYSLWLSADGLPSDVVAGIHTRHADERGPNGELWNSVGHHSFYVAFMRQKAAVIVPPIIDPPTVPGDEVAALRAEVLRLRGIIAEAQKVLGAA